MKKDKDIKKKLGVTAFKFAKQTQKDIAIKKQKAQSNYEHAIRRFNHALVCMKLEKHIKFLN